MTRRHVRLPSLQNWKKEISTFYKSLLSINCWLPSVLLEQNKTHQLEFIWGTEDFTYMRDHKKRKILEMCWIFLVKKAIVRETYGEEKERREQNIASSVWVSCGKIQNECYCPPRCCKLCGDLRLLPLLCVAYSASLVGVRSNGSAVIQPSGPAQLRFQTFANSKSLFSLSLLQHHYGNGYGTNCAALSRTNAHPVHQGEHQMCS